MKTLIASIFALTLIGATATNAEGVGAGVHIGGVGVGIHVGGHHRHCASWGWRHHHSERFCRAWR